MTFQNVFDFLFCGTYLHESSVFLTVLFYPWIGVWEEAVKFGIARLIAKYSERPLFISSFAFGLFEAGLKAFGGGANPFVFVAMPMIHAGISCLGKRYVYAVLIHAVYDISMYYSGWWSSAIFFYTFLFGIYVTFREQK